MIIHHYVLFFENNYAAIKVFIINNRKPKNKYSLIVAGNTIFDNDTLNIKIPYSYGVDCYEKNANIFFRIKDAPNKEDLTVYFNKNKAKILKDFLIEHKKAEAEFEEIKKMTINNKEWEIIYLEEKKYYYENNVCRGTETQEYKEIIKKLKELN